ncbi:MAG: DDE-type integrase/transposase/recombinase [Treponema sp.]|jgi:transposase InsO family protein|nr:DDE-type integrase/transposase/recombinase [Treponema sp.]
MLEEKTRAAIALKRFSLISPIINGQVENIGEYSAEATKAPIEMPHYGFRSYAPKTISNWYSDYIKGGIDALKPSPRSDKGVSRVLTPEMSESILNKLNEHPKAPATVIYEMLVDERAFLKKDASIATVRRFIRENKTALEADGKKTQMLRFSKEQVNQLWQTDIMYGPYVGAKKKQATYLLAYIDDASRLITYAGFYLTQDMASLRNSFKEAVLRRGIPKVIYTDNGKIYRSQSFEYLCANIGVTLLHHAVGAGYQKGKIERFFRTVRLRFVSVLKSADLTDIGLLNEKFGAWLMDDYQKRPHKGLSGETPLNFFLKQANQVNLVSDLGEFNKKLLLSVKRTVKKDATISFNGDLYEAEMFLAGEKLDVKYDPDAGAGINELFLFRGDAPVGTAKLINYNDNSKRKRSGGVKTGKRHATPTDGGASKDEPYAKQKANTISYSTALEG